GGVPTSWLLGALVLHSTCLRKFTLFGSKAREQSKSSSFFQFLSITEVYLSTTLPGIHTKLEFWHLRLS
ncbi:MAG: hypothetical protein O4753_10415, partial [Trichodesmium sp. St7_bin2_1]|nr:hypothetical protein [Trichodesmium sp. St7_bin2_1]